MKNNSDEKSYQEVSFEEVISIWLQDEWHYSFYDEVRNLIDERIIKAPNLNNDSENKTRKSLLMQNRAPIIEKLPDDTKWYSTVLNKKDIERTFLIPMRTGWTNDLTAGSFSISSITGENSLEQIDSEHKRRILGIMSTPDINKRLIFIGSNMTSPLTVIEGNHRLVAILLNALKNNVEDPIIRKLYVGISPQMKDCIFHVEKYR